MGYVVWIGCIVGAIAFYLRPFMDEVYTAKATLCGGNTDFTYTMDYKNEYGGKPVTVLEYGATPSWFSECSAELPDAFLSDTYGITYNRGGTQPATKASSRKPDPATLIPKVVLAHAFRGLGIDVSPAATESINSILSNTKWNISANAELPDLKACEKFDVKSARGCNIEKTDADYCIWSVWTANCEQQSGTSGGPPGLPFIEACCSIHSDHEECQQGDLSVPYAAMSELWCADGTANAGMCLGTQPEPAPEDYYEGHVDDEEHQNDASIADGDQHEGEPAPEDYYEGHVDDEDHQNDASIADGDQHEGEPAPDDYYEGHVDDEEHQEQAGESESESGNVDDDGEESSGDDGEESSGVTNGGSAHDVDDYDDAHATHDDPADEDAEEYAYDYDYQAR